MNPQAPLLQPPLLPVRPHSIPRAPWHDFSEGGQNCIHIGLVNNMPDAALLATERQFLTLLGLAAGGLNIRISLFSLPGVPRSNRAQFHIDRTYSDIDRLWSSQLDGIIVTGAEPIAQNLTDEPYWASLAKLADGAEDNGIASIWSCLAAHAFLLHSDGIERRRLDSKLSGVFQCSKVSGHPLVADLPPQTQMPHSRWNEVPEEALADCGYHVLTRSGLAGADVFMKQGKSLAVLFQGHPEYDGKALLLEYRRDVQRFFRGERDSYPAMPRGCFNKTAAVRLEALRERALSERSDGLLASLSDVILATQVPNAWRPAAVSIYRNWLEQLNQGQAPRSLRTRTA